MKKSLIVVAVLAACAGMAHAQTVTQTPSSMTIYGTFDDGVFKRTGGPLSVGKRDNNKLGFRGVEELGNGLSALVNLEIRFEPDTGSVENGVRPLFQGQSRVGLRGGFGTLRLGRGLSAFEEAVLPFEPWSAVPSVAGFLTDLQVAGYTCDPLSVSGNSGNRISHALFYNSPMLYGFQLNANVASKQPNGSPVIIGRGTAANPQFGANSAAIVVPYSLSLTYLDGPLSGMGAVERNAAGTTFWSVAAYLYPLSALKLLASRQGQNQERNVLANPVTKAWLVGANYTLGAGKLLLGYGMKSPEGAAKTRQASLGYQYYLSNRTYLYVDASTKRLPVAPVLSYASTMNFYSLGVHHNF